MIITVARRVAEFYEYFKDTCCFTFNSKKGYSNPKGRLQIKGNIFFYNGMNVICCGFVCEQEMAKRKENS